MSTKLAIAEPFNANHPSIESYLTELEKYGNPVLRKMDGGWYSKIEVFVTGKGVSFEVDSDFGHSTPTNALALCCDRLKTALEKINQGFEQ